MFVVLNIELGHTDSFHLIVKTVFFEERVEQRLVSRILGSIE